MENGFMKAPMGTKVYANKLQKISKMKAGESIIVCILSKDVIITKIHYTEGLRYFYCIEGICCSKVGLPAVRYVFPVVVYGLDKDGKIDPNSKDWAVRPLVVGAQEYDSILRKHDHSGDIRHQDLMITCTEAEYQKHDLDLMGECQWKHIPVIKEGIKKEVEYYKDNIQTALARTLTEAEILAGLSGTGGFAIEKPELPVVTGGGKAAIENKVAPKEQAKIANNIVLESDTDYDSLFE